MPYMEDFMTTAELAERLGLTVAAVAWRVRQGYLPVAAKAPGPTGAYLFRRSEMEQLLNEEQEAFLGTKDQ